MNSGLYCNHSNIDCDDLDGGFCKRYHCKLTPSIEHPLLITQIPRCTGKVVKLMPAPLPSPEPDVMSHNVGDSNYAQKKIQPWHIWEEYLLNPWDADIVKRVLRDKESQSRKEDYEKIIHICQKRINQIDKGVRGLS